jgi:hypothetical protein
MSSDPHHGNSADLPFNHLLNVKGVLIMSTFASTLPYSGTIPSSQSHKVRLPKDMLTSLQAVRARATTHLAGSLEKATPNSPEKFYQDHVIAIFISIYFETAMGPRLGALGIYLYSHWMM